MSRLKKLPWIMEEGSLVSILIPEGNILYYSWSYNLCSRWLALIVTQLLKDTKMEDIKHILKNNLIQIMECLSLIWYVMLFFLLTD